jgi:hypothetical protein
MQVEIETYYCYRQASRYKKMLNFLPAPLTPDFASTIIFLCSMRLA